ncbi:protein kinase [Streptomyces sp. MS1.AVA.1]|uniref:Protein kinase n=1 Tax=Streptomyces machairae TaxID=3134109 RepID=A0ABU8UJW0_9ACTN
MAGLFAGRYRLLGQRGPSRRMWAAHDTWTGVPVVVHRYPRQDAPQERFLREARALAELRHPNVVRVVDHGVEGGEPYLVAEFVDGVTLAELQLGSGPGSPSGCSPSWWRMSCPRWRPCTSAAWCADRRAGTACCCGRTGRW